MEVGYGSADCCNAGCPCPPACCPPLIPTLLNGIGCAVHRLLVCIDTCVCGCGCWEHCSCGAAGECCVDSCCGAPAGYPLEALPGEYGGEVQMDELWEGDIAPAPGAAPLDSPPPPPKDARRGPARQGLHSRSYSVGQLRPIPASPKTASKPSKASSRGGSGAGDVTWVRYVENTKKSQEVQRPAPRSASGQVEFRIPHNPLR